jgi:hypothetical protein
LPDDEDAIAAKLERVERTKARHLVLTVGGTGLGPRDRTPEATRRVIDREAPGLAEAMRFHGAERNPFAWLSRGVAGLKGHAHRQPARQPARRRREPGLHRWPCSGMAWKSPAAGKPSIAIGLIPRRFLSVRRANGKRWGNAQIRETLSDISAAIDSPVARGKSITQIPVFRPFAHHFRKMPHLRNTGKAYNRLVHEPSQEEIPKKPLTGGAQSVSIRDVAKRAGVSIATVSRASTASPTVDPELAKRVWKAVEEVGYLPNPRRARWSRAAAACWA